jgi:Ca2+-binding EF-hand superfamily protein
MATLSFDGETHGELVVKVRRWLASLEGRDDGTLTRVEAIEQGAELTKEALRLIASSAPEPIAQSELVKALTAMGYKATDATKEAIVDGLDSVEEMTGGSVVRMARETGKSVAYQMNSTIARQILRQLKTR